MIVDEVLELAKIRLQNLAISKNDSVLTKFIYLGESELFRKFNLSIKTETILTNSDLAIYELRNRDVSLLLNLYFEDGKELVQTDTLDAHHWDYKLVNYKSFVLRKPFEGVIYAVYKANPPKLIDGTDEVDLPDAMIDALLLYVSYLAHSTVHSAASVINTRAGSVEYDNYYQKFIAACQELEMQGYKVPLVTEALAIHRRGYK